MINKLRLLLIFSFFVICVYGNTFQIALNPILNIDYILFQKNMFSYWDIIVYVLILFILIPFFYIGYLKNHKILEKYKLYHFEGKYNAANTKDIVEYIEKLEILFGKRFSKFKNLVELFGKNQTEDKKMYAEVIESILFCIKLNGRKRWNVFWDFSDRFFKVIILMLPIIGAFVVIMSEIYFGITGLVLSIAVTIFSIPFILIIFSSVLKFSQYIFRKRGKALPALSLAYFALEALINTNIARAYDKNTDSYYYYTTIHEYNNLVNSKSGFGGVHVGTSSSIIGNIQEQSLGEK